MSEAVQKEEFVKDGYTNLPARLGEASTLQSSGEYNRTNITNDLELLTVLYRENWIAKKIIDMPCEDMTREWYSLSTELKQSLVDKLKKIEAKHNVKGEITSALKWARLYGGSLALIVIKGQEDMLDEELDYDMIMPGSFKGLLVLDKVTGITPSLELVEDMDDPDFNLPVYYDVPIDAFGGSMVRLHHSRVLRFIGRELPPQEEIAENYWGASELEHIYEELQKRNATSANIAQLVFQANTRVLKMADYGEVLGMGDKNNVKEVERNIEAQNRLLTSFGIQIIGKDDDITNHPYTFSGVAEVYESFMMDMAGASGIPATRLFGRSPQGMNATGESDMKNYYESIAQLQERQLRPALEKLIPIMCMSVFGAIPNDMEIVFEPIDTTDPAQRADIMSKFTSSVLDAMSGGLIGRKTGLMELREQGKEIGAWTKITDEIIEEADDEVDNGEMMGGGEMPPDGGMMMGGGMEAPQEKPQEVPPEEPEAPEEKSDEDIVKEIMQEDGGPGSGNFNHPGYSRGGASVAERVRFMANPTEGSPELKRVERTAQSVEKANREREEWGNLSLHQKVQGNAEQEKHMRAVKAEVRKAALKGDMETAKKLVRENRHYFSNDPDSAMKVQSETLARQKKVKPSAFIGGDENDNHDPKNGRFAPANHPTQDEITKAAKKAISDGGGVDKKGMDRHRDKAHAERASEAEYQADLKRYQKAKAKGKDIREPVKRTKSYFEGVNADFIMGKCLDAIDKGMCKWYSKVGGEMKAQVTFNKEVGKTVKRGESEMIPTRTVTVTYSRENGFHCYPDERRG